MAVEIKELVVTASMPSMTDDSSAKNKKEKENDCNDCAEKQAAVETMNQVAKMFENQNER